MRPGRYPARRHDRAPSRARRRRPDAGNAPPAGETPPRRLGVPRRRASVRLAPRQAPSGLVLAGSTRLTSRLFSGLSEVARGERRKKMGGDWSPTLGGVRRKPPPPIT